jgi:hypothetical protein
MDYGDCPESYLTLLADNGARHGPNDPNLYLGDTVDIELDGQPTADANGDDANGVPDDEDGIYFLTNLIMSGPAEVNVIASKQGLLDAWMDFNNDGDFNDPGEQIFTSFPLNDGNNLLTLNVPLSRIPAYSQTSTITVSTYARFRFSSAGGLDPYGPADDGEVEDYKVQDELDCLIGGNVGPFEYSDWVAWNKPKCWCYKRQCRGDINGLAKYGIWVSLEDLYILSIAYGQMPPRMPPGGICADINHQARFGMRVTLEDLTILRTYYGKPQLQVPTCDLAPVITGPYNFWTTP